MLKIILLSLPMSLPLALSPAFAEVAMSGSFVAHQACPATPSIHNEANPGGIKLEPDKSYPLLAQNKPQGAFYLIEIEGAQPAHRWVAASCGEQVASAEGTGSGGSEGAADGGAGEAGKTGQKAEYVFAISWEPAFCETKPDKSECQSETPTSFDATHFSLHGLWPQPRGLSYCNVSRDLVSLDKFKDWDQLPEPALTDATRQALEQVMPGTKSNLQRHEWYTHGTCFGASADTYFHDAVALMTQINASKVRDLFAASIGNELTADAIRSAFDESFGPGAGSRVLVSCKKQDGQNMIVEIDIALAGDMGDEPSLPALIAAAGASQRGCPNGLVDSAGAR
jgi:ribonuclease T2